MPKDESFNFSRRDFLKTAGVSSLVTAVANVGEAEAQTAGAQPIGPGEVPVQLMGNGKRIDLKIEPRGTLLDAPPLRADMTGNKRGCGRGQRGASPMIGDGRAVYSSST